MNVHILGVRHHGPGSARSILAALESIRPQALLVEGPPDADDLIALAGHPEMRPPAALLVYRPDEPKRAVFYPFAEFSPEWQAIRWALSRQIHVRFMDLPQRHRLVLEAEQTGEPAPDEAANRQMRRDPLGLLAEAAGFSDRERWWEEQFEKRYSGPEVFTAVLELMTAMREDQPAPDPLEAQREAWMRQTMRAAQKEGHAEIAVVCGAWHAPALNDMPTAKSDAELLRGLPKVQVAATWLPWTHRRLTFASGYGAGVHSPGYYEHLWTTGARGELATRWMTRVAHLLRKEDLESSTASLDRSRLLHRLRLLHVEWGKPSQARGKGTFREAWVLRWEPELEVALIEAAPWGNTIAEAASRFAIERAAQSATLPELTRLAEMLLVADLPEAIGRVMQQLENQAALTSDVAHLMDALPPLAAVLRYGNVRQTDASMVGHIVRGLVARICIGLVPACASLNDEAAAEMLRRLDATHGALATLGDEELSAPWTTILERFAESDTLHGLLAGRSTRLLLDAGKLPAETVAARLSRHLSRANAPTQTAAWIEGFLGGSGLVLLHQPGLWGLLDSWLASLTDEHFLEVLPLLRRTFATFPLPERRQMSELTRRHDAATPAAAPADDDIDEARANRLIPVFATILGTPPPS